MSTLLRKKTNTDYTGYLACGTGLNELVAQEITALGVVPKIGRKGVQFTTDLEGIYRVAAFSRLASRLMIQVHHCKRDKFMPDPYQISLGVDWPSIFKRDADFSCSVTSVDPNHNTQYFNLKFKDAVADVFREKFGERPNVNRENPAMRLYLHLEWKEAFYYIDPFGSLHERGYRKEAGIAPIKETLAAAMLQMSGFDDAPGTVLDPFCGSGTIPIEAALRYLKTPNARVAKLDTLKCWNDHQNAMFRRVFAPASDLLEKTSRAPIFLGSDESDKILEIARNNSSIAGVSGLLKFEQRDVLDTTPLTNKGYIVCNPPYGERFKVQDIITFYRNFYKHFATNFPGWKLAIISSNVDALNALGVRALASLKTKNGPVNSEIRVFQL